MNWRTHWPTGVLFAFLAASAIGMPRAAAQRAAAEIDSPPPTVDEAICDDAALTNVCFVDRNTGWAVGDRGVIWHTRDGGASWRRQASGVAAPLKSVYFLDAARGWAVGGANRPYAAGTEGIVLQTIDGGATWARLASEMLPALAGVRFFDAQHGLAFGGASPTASSGLFATRDGGRSWLPLPGDGAGDWLAGDFLDPVAGALAGSGGRFATLARRQVITSPLATTSLRSFRAMRLLPPTGGWVVGDGGLVATTGDLGRSWQTPAGDLPDRAADHFDFCAVAVQGPHVWIAGSPGSRVFRSSDGGQTWQAHATGRAAPIRALDFVDDRHGWAVGDLGAILATQDGGRSWREQRSGGKRAALLAIFARPDGVPLEILAKQGAEEGYLAAVEVLFQTESQAAPNRGLQEAPDDAARSARTREALLLAGATSAETAWQFRLPPDELALTAAEIAEALDRANDGRASERLLAHLVRQIRMWRPNVIISHHLPNELNDPLAAIVAPLVSRAIEAAADPTQFVELATAAGLDAWQVERQYGLQPPGAKGSQRTTTGQFASLLGATLAEWSAPARRLLVAEYVPPPDAWEMELLMGRTAAALSARGLFDGIVLVSGGDARRRSTRPPEGDLDALRRQAARRRGLEKLLQQSEGNAAWAAQIAQLTDSLSATGGGELMGQLADGYRVSGRLDLAADTYYLLARQYPDQPLAEQALRWLVQYYASGEAAERSRNADFALRDDPQASQSEIRVPKSEIELSTDVQQASAAVPMRDGPPPAVGLSRDERLGRAVELGKYLESARPALFAEPRVRFPLVAAERQLGFANPAKRYFITLRSRPERDPWRRCAEAEEWLAEPTELPPPKPLMACRPASRRPHLDGKLDEAFWQAAEAVRLRDDAEQDGGRGEAQRGTVVRFAYDPQFLYLAIECPKVDGGDYAHHDRPRPRDSELSTHDRVAIRFDVDRDYTTYFELVVDHRGWTHDACWSDAHWDPTWYVAAADDESTWTVEAAVPLAELVRAPPAARHVWAVSARRTIPRVGFESWAGEARHGASPEQFGLMIFE